MEKQFTYIESISYLYNLQKFGMKFGLAGIRRLLKYLDNPERKFSSIHIAGTNGKGSTASLIASVFVEAGYKVGLYTSPHLVSFNERIRINGKPISSKSVTQLVSKIRPEVEKNNSTFFETVTALAFKYFADSKVDIAIIETGLGGRLDATNVLSPLVTVITSIGLEHTEILGDTIKEIALEKAGIIKRDIPCVSGVRKSDAIKVLQNVCREKKSEFIPVKTNKFRVHKSSLNGLVVDIPFSGAILKNTKVSLTGDFQINNIAIALKTIEVVVKNYSFSITEEVLRNGLKNVHYNSGITARLSLIKRHPLTIVDVAHNPEAIRSLRKSLQKLCKKKFLIVVGLMKDKDYKKIIRELRCIVQMAYLVKARTERSRSVIDLAKEFQKYNIEAKEFSSVSLGVETALARNKKYPILITGSHFVVGEAIAYLKKEKYLTINQ